MGDNAIMTDTVNDSAPDMFDLDSDNDGKEFPDRCQNLSEPMCHKGLRLIAAYIDQYHTCRSLTEPPRRISTRCTGMTTYQENRGDVQCATD